MEKMMVIFLTFLTSFSAIIFNQNGNFMGGGEGGGEPSGGEDGGDTTPDGGGSDDGPQYAYPEGFDDTLKGNPTLKKFANDKGEFNYANIMKSLVHLQGTLGKDKVSLPDETWTDDQYGELYNKLGRPADISEYSLENKLHEGIEEDPKFFEGMKKAAYDAGLAPKQAQKVLDYVNDYVGTTLKESSELSAAQFEQDKKALMQEWGDMYQHKTQRAFHALEQFASPEEIKEMGEKGLLSSPVMTKLFDKIADGFSEDNFQFKQKGTFGMTPQEAADEIQKMYQKDHPYMNKHHPENKHYQQKMLKLQAIKVAAKKK